MSMHRSQPSDIEVTVTVLRQGSNAVLVSDTGEEDNAVWLPWSQCRDEYIENARRGENLTLTIPEWLARERGLI